MEKMTEEQVKKLMEEQGIDDNMLDQCTAYIEAFGATDLSDFEDAYSGEYEDDEDFARNMAEDLGSVKNDGQWPNYCIDWDYAAREIMMDYTEQDGYYFRNL